VRRRSALGTLTAAALLGLAGATAAQGSTPYRGTARPTRAKVKLQISATGRVRFTYACRENKQPYVYTGRLRRGRFHIVRHSEVIRKLTVVDLSGLVSATRARGTLRQDVCQGAVERWSATRHG
jgi:hypothetical protein